MLCGPVLVRRNRWQRERGAGNDLCGTSGTLRAMNGASRIVGHRVLVAGMTGSGKSTFARALAARTGLPVIHLDLHYWKPGWARPSDGEWRDRQRALIAGEAWVIDGNYNDTLPLRLERAETVFLLDAPWWLCASRAFARGLRKPGGEMPGGCEDSRQPTLARRVGRHWEDLAQPPGRARASTRMVSEHGSHAALHVLRSKREAKEFLSRLSGE